MTADPAVAKTTELSPRGTLSCRACGHGHLASVLDLGVQPLANELLPEADTPDAPFPLHLRICPACGLGQVGEFVLPERLFGDYPYLSSVSQSWLAHARRYAAEMDAELGLASGGGSVVEVASNDGYLLREFQALGVDVLGVEPAANVAELARSRGVDTLTAFFGRETAHRVVAERGHPRLVAANNVMAHVPDLDDFVGGFAELCDDTTVVTVENPSFVTLLNETQFDTIYHEHYSYLSAHAVGRLVEQHGLELVDVTGMPTHGGSYRYTIVRAGTRAALPSVAEAVERELGSGLLKEATWWAFADRSRATMSGLQTWLAERAAAGDRVAAYGAAAKGNTLLNAAGTRVGDILAVADGSPEKQGKFLPGSRIPVVAPESLPATGADDILVLPWNIAPEIGALVRRLLPEGRAWIAVPTMKALVDET
jgi:hypothetical protein